MAKITVIFILATIATASNFVFVKSAALSLFGSKEPEIDRLITYIAKDQYTDSNKWAVGFLIKNELIELCKCYSGFEKCNLDEEATKLARITLKNNDGSKISKEIDSAECVSHDQETVYIARVNKKWRRIAPSNIKLAVNPEKQPLLLAQDPNAIGY